MGADVMMRLTQSGRGYGVLLLKRKSGSSFGKLFVLHCQPTTSVLLAIYLPLQLCTEGEHSTCLEGLPTLERSLAATWVPV